MIWCMKGLTRSDAASLLPLFVVTIEPTESNNANPITIAIGLFESMSFLCKRKIKEIPPAILQKIY